MPEITFTEVEVPETIVERKENPFMPLINELLKNGKARAFTLPAKTSSDEKAIESAVGHIQRAARTVDKSARKKIVREKDVATITVWLVDKITRERNAPTS